MISPKGRYMSIFAQIYDLAASQVTNRLDVHLGTIYKNTESVTRYYRTVYRCWCRAHYIQEGGRIASQEI